jgi:hypothetical protein
MTFQRQVTVRINDVYNLVTNKYNDRFSGFRIFSLNVGEAMLSDCGRPFHSTLSLVSVMAW